MLCADSVVGAMIMQDSLSLTIKPGMPFSVEGMELERRRVTDLLRNNGYYRFQKEHITYTADTAHHSNKVRLTMNIAGFMPAANVEPVNHKAYRIGEIYYVAHAGLHLDDALLAQCDTVVDGGVRILYNGSQVVRTKTLLDNTFITAGELFSQDNVDKTYNSFSQLSALKYTTVRLQERPDTAILDCYIMYEKSKRCTVGFDLDGTNTAGNFGALASVTLSDKNLFKGSEQLALRLFAAYEAVSDLTGYNGNKFFEYGAELSLRFKGGVLSSLIPVDKRKLVSSSQFALKFNSQERPEFNRELI